MKKIKTLYYKITNKDNKFNFNITEFNTNPKTNSYLIIIKLTDSDYNEIDDAFLSWHNYFIPPDNAINSNIYTTWAYNSLIINDTKNSIINAELLVPKKKIYSGEIINDEEILYWTITGGTGIYKKAKRIKMTLLNPTDKYPYFRRILSIYK
jgi:hypothetical protein